MKKLYSLLLLVLIVPCAFLCLSCGKTSFEEIAGNYTLASFHDYKRTVRLSGSDIETTEDYMTSALVGAVLEINANGTAKIVLPNELIEGESAYVNLKMGKKKEKFVFSFVNTNSLVLQQGTELHNKLIVDSSFSKLKTSRIFLNSDKIDSSVTEGIMKVEYGTYISFRGPVIY